MLPLPIDPLLPEVVAQLRAHPALVLEAPPGAGKTTRVPGAVLDSGLAGDREVVVLQPRRLATRLAAQRVAEERGEAVGGQVGYQVRFEEVTGPRTRLRFVTEGVLTRQLLSDPTLSRVGVVVLDEFHERHLATDLALAWLRRLQQGQRPDLKLLVMSATLDAAPIAAYLGGCPTLRSEGRRFEVAIEHLAAPDERPLEAQIASALKRTFAQDPAEGHWLVFLPGAGEIRRARDACAEFADRQGLELLPLHGDLPASDQDRAVRPSKRRKVILSTNVAETSVTIDGVAWVVDSGLARTAAHSPWSGLPTLKTAKVSRASARQRTGRAGRTREGRCLRLFTRADFEARPEHDVPEIRRLDLTETVLALRASGIRDPARFPFFEAPPPAALEAADALLRRLRAIEPSGELTPLGRTLLSYPLHPRLARLAIDANARGAGDAGVTVAALLSERDIRRRARVDLTRSTSRGTSTHGFESDLLELWSLFQEADHAGHDLDAAAVRAVARVRGQLLRRMRPTPTRAEDIEAALGMAILSAFPDRVARRRKAGAPELVLAGGGSAILGEGSAVQHATLLVAVDAEDSPRGVRVRLASAIEPEWLLDLFPEALKDEDAVVWNEKLERVERVTRLAYEDLTLEETRNVAPPSEAASALLRASAVAGESARWTGSAEAGARLEARLRWAAEANPGAAFPGFSTLLADALALIAEGKRSFEELREAAPLDVAVGLLSATQRRALELSAPDRVPLPSGRSLVVHYETSQPPWVESRLQDFFGMAQGPTLGERRLALVLHLLAPNGRDVQVTTDLGGFWDRHYPALRRELSRRYPRHAWPEDPRNASPTPPRRRG